MGTWGHLRTQENMGTPRDTRGHGRRLGHMGTLRDKGVTGWGDIRVPMGMGGEG